MTEKEFELYLTKLEDCDQEYFNKLSVLDEVAFFTELQSYLRADAGLREDFADGLLAFFEQYGNFGNSVNHDMAEWLVYQDNDYYEYGDSPLEASVDLAGALYQIEYDAGALEWERTGCYWYIMAESLGYDKDGFIGMIDTVLSNCLDEPYPDYTTPETRLIVSEMFYNHLTAIDDWDDTDNIKEAMRILSISDVRKAKIKSLAGARNKKAPEIYDRLCRKTAIAMYYCYHKLGNEKMALKELKKANITDAEMTLTVFDSFEVENPYYKIPELSAEPIDKKSRTSGRPRKRKSLVSLIIKKLKKMFK